MPGYWELFIQLENEDGDVETIRFDMACCDQAPALGGLGRLRQAERDYRDG